MQSFTTALTSSYKGWQGVLGLEKLHSIAVWCNKHPNHAKAWRDHVGVKLGMDNATRWNSWYKVLDVAIRKKKRIINFMLDYAAFPAEHRLTDDD